MRQAGLLAVLIMLVGGMLLTINPGQLPANQPLSAEQQAQASFFKVPLSFEPNRGQTDAQADFLARGPGYTLFLTPAEAVIALPSRTATEESKTETGNDPVAPSSSFGPSERGAGPVPQGNEPEQQSPNHETAVLRMQLIGANPAAKSESVETLPGKSNYFFGNDPAKWRTNIPHYSKVAYREVYPGIDLVYYGNQRQLEYDFIVAPGGDPNAIRWNFEGADSLTLDPSGNLVIDLPGHQVVQQAPVAYQDFGGRRQPVRGGYTIAKGNVAAFKVGSYDPTKPLVIDPVIFAFSTFLGGSGGEAARGVALDPAGNIYMAGTTLSSGFGDGNDIFITKFSPNATNLIYTAILGGSGRDEPQGFAVDSSGNAYLAGTTESTDFPTQNAFQSTLGDGIPPPTPGGSGDAFLLKLNPQGGGLVYSTYLGGVSGDHGTAVAADDAGNAYIAGYTNSTQFPTVNPLQSNCNCPGTDTFVAKFDPVGTPIYSTFLGGSGTDQNFGIAADAAGNAYITGRTTSSNFPTTSGVFMTSGTGENGFVSKLDATGSTLVFSTYLGGGDSDYGTGIAVDTNNNAYVTGITAISKFSTDGSALVYSSYLGRPGIVTGNGVAVDSSGNAYLAFNRVSSSPHTATVSSITVDKVNADGNARIYSKVIIATRLGAEGIAVDSAGSAYVAGWGGEDYSVTPGAFQTTFGGGFSDTILFKVEEVADNPVPALLSLSSASIPARSSGIFLDVVGAWFVDGSVVRWNGSDLPTTYSNDFRLRATISDSDIVTPGPVQVTVFSPAPGGGTSNPLTFTILDENPIPSIHMTFSPVGVNAGGPDFTLSVKGWNYIPESIVRWNTADRPTTFVDSRHLQVVISAANISSPGTAFIDVFNPAPGGGASAQLPYTIQSAAPTLASLTPTTVTAGDAGFTLSVTGTNFVTASVVRWNGQNRTTTFVSDTVLEAAIPASDLTLAGTFPVTVFNPFPNGGTSNSLSFSVQGNSVPAIASISPSSATNGDPGFTLSVNGTGFATDSVIRWNGVNRTTTFVGSTQLTATISNADIASVGTAQVTVFSPAPGGGTSNALTFSITAPADNPVPSISSLSPGRVTAGSAGFTLSINGVSFINGSVVRWNGNDRTTTFLNDTQLTAAIPASDIATAGTAQVSVFSPAPGGGVSNELPFTIEGTTLGLSVTSIQFPNQLVGASSLPISVTLTNTGTLPLNISSVTATAEFGFTNTCNTPVGVGVGCDISVFFQPAQANARSGTLTITTDADGSPHTVALSGSGVDFEMNTGGGQNTKTVTAGQTATFPITINPISGFTQTISFSCSSPIALSTCTLSPTSVTPDGINPSTINVTVTTTAASTALPLSRRFLPPAGPAPLLLFTLALLATSLMLGMLVGNSRRRVRFGMVFALLSMLWLAGCGGASTPPIINPGTPLGSHSLTVTGSVSQGGVTLTHDSVLTLVVN